MCKSPRWNEARVQSVSSRATHLSRIAWTCILQQCHGVALVALLWPFPRIFFDHFGEVTSLVAFQFSSSECLPLCHLRVKSASSEAAWKERGQSDAIEPCINSQSTCFTHLASHKSPLSNSPHKQSLPFKHLDHKRLVIKYSKYLQIFPKLSIPNQI